MDPTTTFLPVVYAVYGLFSIGLTIWLARILGSNGLVFLKDVFDDQPELAKSVNRLLVVGFYLVNFGYACLLLEGGYAPTIVDAVEVLASKMGFLLLSLAFMHFINLFIFQRIRRRARMKQHYPPVAPQLRAAPASTYAPAFDYAQNGTPHPAAPCT